MRLHDHPLMQAVAKSGMPASRVVGVSGGADSVALLRAVVLLRDRDVEQVIVAHLDHSLRTESADDAVWVSRLADSLGLDALVERCDVRKYAEANGVGVEEAARRCRYEFLCRVAGDRNCDVIAVAHTADDQAETILHHLLRGTGLSGLRGMPASRDLDGVALWRPLLSVSRSDVLDFLTLLKQPYLADVSNRDESYTRNRIRHSLLPLLREQFNPNVSQAIARLGEQARASGEIIEQLAAELLTKAVVQRDENRVALQAAVLQGAARHLVREALRLLFVQQEWPRQKMGFDDWDRLAELAQASQAPGSLSLPRAVKATYRRGVVTIERS